MDVVYNHFGPEGNYLTEFGPYLSAHETPWGSRLVNFDGPGSDEVRRFVIDNALMWLRDYHCDGLRLDAVHAIADQSATHILEALTIEVDALAAHLNRPLFVIAESDLNDPRLVRSRVCLRHGIVAPGRPMASCPARHADRRSNRRRKRRRPAARAGQGTAPGMGVRRHLLPVPPADPRPTADGPVWQPVRGVHAKPRPGRNRALGERSSALMSEGRLRVAVALLLTSPFVPLLFQGEEWGATTPFQYFTDHQDPELGRKVSEGRRRDLSALGRDRATCRSAGSGGVQALQARLDRAPKGPPCRPSGLASPTDRSSPTHPRAHRSPPRPHQDRIRPRSTLAHRAPRTSHGGRQPRYRSLDFRSRRGDGASRRLRPQDQADTQKPRHATRHRGHLDRGKRAFTPAWASTRGARRHLAAPST